MCFWSVLSQALPEPWYRKPNTPFLDNIFYFPNPTLTCVTYLGMVKFRADHVSEGSRAAMSLHSRGQDCCPAGHGALPLLHRSMTPFVDLPRMPILFENIGIAPERWHPMHKYSTYAGCSRRGTRGNPGSVRLVHRDVINFEAVTVICAPGRDRFQGYGRRIDFISSFHARCPREF